MAVTTSVKKERRRLAVPLEKLNWQCQWAIWPLQLLWWKVFAISRIAGVQGGKMFHVYEQWLSQGVLALVFFTSVINGSDMGPSNSSLSWWSLPSMITVTSLARRTTVFRISSHFSHSWVWAGFPHLIAVPQTPPLELLFIWHEADQEEHIPRKNIDILSSHHCTSKVHEFISWFL